MLCPCCSKERPDDYFPKKDKSKCNSCYNKRYYTPRISPEEREERRNTRKERYKLRDKERYMKRKNSKENNPQILRKNNVELFIWRGAKARAKNKNLPFNIEVSDIIVPAHCPILGIPIKVNDKRPEHNSISLDRIVPHLGYVKGNIQIVSALANVMKSNASEQNLVAFAEWVFRTYVNTETSESV